MNIRWEGIEDIPWDLIEAHPKNPNVLDEGGMRALKDELAVRGFVAPCLVWPHPQEDGKYQLIDGEHRWRVAGELGHETVPCVVDRHTDETQVLVHLISSNRLQGQPVPARVAHLLAELRKEVPESELRDRINLSQATLANYLALEDFLEDGDGVGVPRPKGEPDSRVEVAVVATQGQAERITNLLGTLTGGDAEKEAAVLSRRAREWVEND